MGFGKRRIYDYPYTDKDETLAPGEGYEAHSTLGRFMACFPRKLHGVATA
jgi:hypothetical protein